MRRVDTNLVIALAALLTSVIAVWVAWDESRVQRRSQRASFMPILEVEMSLQGVTGSQTAAASVSVRNAGSGVAFVESAELRIDGDPVDSYQALAASLFSPSLAASADFSWETLRGYIGPDEVKAALVFRWPPGETVRREFEALVSGDSLVKNLERSELSLCYCSIFDECWQVTSWSVERPAPVRRCRGAEDAIERIWQSYYASRGDADAPPTANAADTDGEVP
jgi:hypothetical protein